MKEKYIELLLKRCLKIEDTNSLFVSYNKINSDFAKMVLEYAKKLGIKDVYLDEEDSYYIHDLLKTLSKDEIENHEAFNSKVWDEYAKKNAAFLMLDTEIPDLMSDIDSEIIAKSSFVKRNTKPIYREMQMSSKLAWCIGVVPNELWAKKIFKDSDNPLDEFWQYIAKFCFLDKDDPIKEWDILLKEDAELTKKLNDLKIKELHFTNELGTDLKIELNENAIWNSTASNEWISNMPSYELFTTPDYRKTEGIVYATKPLCYNGKIIEEFNVTFKEGKVVEFHAKKGEDILKEIIDGDELTSYLGEVAIVDYNSPISLSNRVFESTLLDENASCHIALGSGFTECIKNGKDLKEEELKELGVNLSKNHVDFMIGSKDLIIEAKTKNGNILIMENGNLII